MVAVPLLYRNCTVLYLNTSKNKIVIVPLKNLYKNHIKHLNNGKKTSSRHLTWQIYLCVSLKRCKVKEAAQLGRQGKKTILGTSIDELLAKAIDLYIEKQPKKLLLKEHSNRAEIIQDAVLLFLALKGELEPTLKALQMEDSEIQSIVKHLKAEYDIPPKS